MNQADDATKITGYHLGYRPALDGLRAFAVLWVIGFHYHLPFGRDGLFGVDIFFTLSGFLITVLLLEEWSHTGRISLKNFYIRRVLRLYPALVLMLFVFGSLVPLGYVFSTLFYSTNWIKALHVLPDSIYLDHTWSLSIEEQFYLLWPAALMLMLRMKVQPRRMALITAGLGLISAIWRAVYWNATQDWFRVYMGTDMHADGLLLGSGLAILTFYGLLPDFNQHRRLITSITILAVLVIAGLVFDIFLQQGFIPTIGNLIISLATLVLVTRLVIIPVPAIKKIFENRIMVMVGKISYGLYLWHAPVGEFIQKAGWFQSPTLDAVIKVLLTFAAAGLSYWLVEKRILKLKNKLSLGKTNIAKLAN